MMRDRLSSRAIAAAVAVAEVHGIRCDGPDVVADGSNVLVHLKPAPVVARVATTTGLVRKPAQWWLALDLDMAGYLAAQNFPVVRPSAEVPPGPHLQDGLALSFWEFVEHDRNYVASAAEVGPLLRELHAVLRTYPGELRYLSPFTEIPQWLDEVGRWNAVNEADLAMLGRGYFEIAAQIEALALPEQPLHGDAHRKNTLKTSKGLVWTDFEDACRGPIAWDLACFVRTSGEHRETALASYRAAIEPEHLEPFFAARDLQGHCGARFFPRDLPTGGSGRRSGWRCAGRGMGEFPKSPLSGPLQETCSLNRSMSDSVLLSSVERGRLFLE